MKRLTLSILLLGSFAQTLRADMKSIYTPYELDIQEARLHQQWKRVDEVMTAHRKFISIRRDLIINGFEQGINDWHSGINQWIGNWKSTTDALKGDGLSDKQLQEDVIRQVKEQIIQLNAMRDKIQGILDQGSLAYRELQALPTFPGDYIDINENSDTDTYKDQIALYQRQVNEAKANVLQAQGAFTRDLVTDLESLTQTLNDAVVVKMKALSVRFPALKDAIARTESSLALLRIVDAVIGRLQKDSESISEEIAMEQVYTAKAHIAAWKAQAAVEVQTIANNPKVPASMVRYARDMIQGLSDTRDSQLNTQLASRKAVEMFATYYDRELYGPFGIVQECLQDERPLWLDCNLLRTIQGFKREQILKLTDAQAAYIESLIAKVKRGVHRT